MIQFFSGDETKMNTQKAFNDAEYLKLTNDILTNEEFKKLQWESHHMIGSRYSHNISVSYTSYKIAKALNLDVRSATRAALLHDFYLDSDGEGFKGMLEELDGTRSQHKTLWARVKGIRFKQVAESMNILLAHPYIASERAKKIFNITEKEQNIIRSHMWPIGLEVPKHREGWIVTLVDNAYSMYEFGIKYRKVAAMITLMLIIW